MELFTYYQLLISSSKLRVLDKKLNRVLEPKNALLAQPYSLHYPDYTINTDNVLKRTIYT